MGKGSGCVDAPARRRLWTSGRSRRSSIAARSDHATMRAETRRGLHESKQISKGGLPGVQWTSPPQNARGCTSSCHEVQNQRDTRLDCRRGSHKICMNRDDKAMLDGVFQADFKIEKIRPTPSAAPKRRNKKRRFPLTHEALAIQTSYGRVKLLIRALARHCLMEARKDRREPNFETRLAASWAWDFLQRQPTRAGWTRFEMRIERPRLLCQWLFELSETGAGAVPRSMLVHHRRAPCQGLAPPCFPCSPCRNLDDRMFANRQRAVQGCATLANGAWSLCRRIGKCTRVAICPERVRQVCLSKRLRVWTDRRARAEIDRASMSICFTPQIFCPRIRNGMQQKRFARNQKKDGRLASVIHLMLQRSRQCPAGTLLPIHVGCHAACNESDKCRRFEIGRRGRSLKMRAHSGIRPGASVVELGASLAASFSAGRREKVAARANPER